MSILIPFRRLYGIATFVACMGAVLDSARPQAQTIESHQVEKLQSLGREAAKALTEANWPKAQQLYGEILALDQENALIQANLGIVEYQLGDFRAAATYLESALKTEPQLHRSRELLGMTYFQLKDPMRALSELTRAAADQPTEPRVFNQLAIVLQDLGWLMGAEKMLRKAIDLDPEFGEGHFNLALVYLSLQPPSPDLAKHHYQKALQLGVSEDKLLEKDLEEITAPSE